ncbi:MAG TPA: ATP-binding protein, partial [Candidatus Limnocylindrales bacterium]|nr:ATP-binding protein [Candidatus Limnocylindrales bacterium]
MDAWPFEGREEELALIRSTFLGTQNNALVFTAPAGLGKTRLARQALSTLEATTRVWVGATRAAASVPLGAVASLFPDDAPAGGPVELMCATLRHLRKLGGRRQVAIVVDDAHLLDDASCTLIAHMVTSKVAFVIMTVRSGERTPDVLLKLCKESHARRV